MKNYYEILEIIITASQDEIKKAYRLKAVKYHPDKHFGDRYFADKFIEVKEAYDILSDEQKRKEYDEQYKIYFSKSEPQEEKVKKQREREEEDKFRYDPYKPFYSYQDRATQETPQFNPKINHWGELLSADTDFFILPKKIGKIISGWSTLTKDKNPSSRNEKTKQYTKKFLIGAVVSTALILIFQIHNPIWIGIWIAIPIAWAILVASVDVSFSHTCNFIGINGFAKYSCKEDRGNIIEKIEVNFNEVTDFITAQEAFSRNFVYQHTSCLFVWLNRESVVNRTEVTHSSKEGNPPRDKDLYWLHTWAERYWTIYLLDNMEKELEKRGYLIFNLCNIPDPPFKLIPFIHLGIGFIKFLTDKGDVTYNFNEIKKVYTKGTNLFIEHINYEKKFFIFESGNKNGIPLLNLSNRQFFFKAMELLIGYKLSKTSS